MKKSISVFLCIVVLLFTLCNSMAFASSGEAVAEQKFATKEELISEDGTIDLTKTSSPDTWKAFFAKTFSTDIDEPVMAKKMAKFTWASIGSSQDVTIDLSPVQLITSLKDFEVYAVPKTLLPFSENKKLSTLLVNANYPSKGSPLVDYSELAQLPALKQLTYSFYGSNEKNTIGLNEGLTAQPKLTRLVLANVSGVSAPLTLSLRDLTCQKTLSELHIKDDNLIITDWDALPEFKKLVTLDISNPSFDPAGMEGVKGLKWLTMSGVETKALNAILDAQKKSLGTLDLSDCTFDDETMAIIGGMSKLKSIILTNVKTNSLEALGELKSLESIHLTRITGTKDFLAAFANCKKLDSLRVIDCGITDISSVSGMTKLVSIDLSQNEITDISALSELKKLCSIDLRYNAVSNVSELAGLPSLDYLSIDGGVKGVSDLQENTKSTTLTVYQDDTQAINGSVAKYYDYYNFDTYRYGYLYIPEYEYEKPDLPADAPVDENQVILFNDPVVESAIRGLLKIESGDVTVEDADRIAVLHIYDERFEGSVDLSVLKALRGLAELNIVWTDVISYEALASCPSRVFTTLRFDSVESIEQMKEINGKMPNLKSFEADYCNIPNLNFLSEYSGLERIVLTDTKTTNVDGIVKFPLLTTFYCDSDFKTPEAMIGLTNMSQLSVCGLNKQDTLTVIKNNMDTFSGNLVLRNCVLGEEACELLASVNANTMYLAGSQIHSLAFLESRELLELNLNETICDDYSPVGTLKEMSNLNLDSCNLTDISFLKNIAFYKDGYNTSLSLSYNPITDISVLSKHTDLKNLYLFETKITSVSGLENIKELSYLVLPTTVTDVAELRQALPNLSISIN